MAFGPSTSWLPALSVSHGPDFIAWQCRFSDKSNSKHGEGRAFLFVTLRAEQSKMETAEFLNILVSPPTLWSWQSWDVKSFPVDDDRREQEPKAFCPTLSSDHCVSSCSSVEEFKNNLLKRLQPWHQTHLLKSFCWHFFRTFSFVQSHYWTLMEISLI